MSRIFISHSSHNNDWAISVRDWLIDNGWSDIFLDLDPERGIAAGQRWQEALQKAAHRCEVVLALVTPQWLASEWCRSELSVARLLAKKVIVLVKSMEPAQLPADLRSEQWVDVTNDPNALPRLKEGLRRAGLDPASFPFAEGRRPYPGLAPLTEDDAAIFFGRDAQIIEAIDRLRGMARAGIKHLLVILGASGAGKSSFLRAGLWPRLKRDDRDWLPLPIIRPERAVLSGKFGLAHALETLIATPPFTQHFLAAGLPRSRGDILRHLGSDHLAPLLRGLRAASQSNVSNGSSHAPHFILAIDQAEELFNDEGQYEADRFADLLSDTLAEDRHVLALLTARSDAFPRFQQDRRFTTVPKETFGLDAMLEGSYQTVIEGPAALVRPYPLVIDPKLTAALLRDVKGQDALPLLAFTLERLFVDYGKSNRLTLAEYERLGGVRGSIEAAIASALSNPSGVPAIPARKEEQLTCLREAFIPWLARIDPEAGTPLRRVARLAEIPVTSRSIVARLVDARVLIADRRNDIDVIEVAHESLLRCWPALAGWLDEDADNLKLIESVERAAGEWVRNGRVEAWLDHRAQRLEAAQALASRADFRQRLGEDGNAYLAACWAREEASRKDKEEALAREQARLQQIAVAQQRTARSQKITRRALSAIGLALLIGFALGTWQYSTNLALQASLDARQVSLLSGFAGFERLRGNVDGSLRLAMHAVQKALATGLDAPKVSAAVVELAAAFFQTGWRIVLSGHESGVWHASFSPEPKGPVITTSYDGTARLWEATTGKQIRILRGHTDEVVSAAFSSDGSRIVTTSRDKTARVWNVSTGKELMSLQAHSDEVLAAAFSPDASWIVTASRDGTARIWNAANGTPARVLLQDHGRLTSVAINAMGTRVVIGSLDGNAYVVDINTTSQPLVLKGHNGGVGSVAFSPDGMQVATASQDGTAMLWSSTNGSRLATFETHEDWVTSVAFNADGTRLVSASVDNTARLWDTQKLSEATKLKEIAILHGHEGSVLSARFSPGGDRIITASFDGTARIWDAIVGKAIEEFRDQGPLWKAAFSPDGKRIITASQDNKARIFRLGQQQKEPERTFEGHTGWVTFVSFDATGDRILTASQDHTARVWNANATTDAHIGTLEGHTDAVTAASFSPDGKRILTASYDRTARIWDASTLKQLMVLDSHKAGVLSAAFNSDGTKIVTTSHDNTARIWDAASGTELHILKGHAGGVWDAAFSSDRAWVVTGAIDRTARIWEVATGKEIRVLRGHEDWVWGADISRDGKRVATASQDKTARIWNADTGVQLAILRTIEAGVWSVEFNAEGTHVVTASQDGVARVWEVNTKAMTPQQLIEEVCTNRLGGLSVFSKNEMRLAGYGDEVPIDVCRRD